MRPERTRLLVAALLALCLFSIGAVTIAIKAGRPSTKISERTR